MKGDDIVDKILLLIVGAFMYIIAWVLSIFAYMRIAVVEWSAVPTNVFVTTTILVILAFIFYLGLVFEES